MLKAVLATPFTTQPTTKRLDYVVRWWWILFHRANGRPEEDTLSHTLCEVCSPGSAGVPGLTKCPARLAEGVRIRGGAL